MFADRLKTLRKESGLTQVQFAAEMSVASGTVAMWETKKREPSFEALVKIADYFGVTLDYLLGRVDRPDGHLIQKEKLPTKLVDSGVEAVTKVGSPTLTEQEESVLKLFAQQLLAQQQQD